VATSRALDVRICSTWDGVRPGRSARSLATTPLVMAAAMDVPVRARYRPDGEVERIDQPGLASVTCGPLVEARSGESRWLTAATASTCGYAAGYSTALPARPPLPLAATTTIPRRTASLMASRSSAENP